MRSPLPKYQSEATVRGPSLPIYMIRIDSSFAPIPRSVVIPVERPTVPKALVTSKSASHQRNLRLQNHHQPGTCGYDSCSQQGYDRCFPESILRDRMMESFFGCVGCRCFNTLQQNEKGTRFNSAPGRAGRSHQ